MGGITVLTDFDHTDSCVGVVKGVVAAMLERQGLDILSTQPDDMAQVLELQQAALGLYQQAIDLEPQYPDAHKRFITLSIGLTVSEPGPDLDTIEDLGEIFLNLPEPVRRPTITNLQALAQVYETSPEWQRSMEDDPDLLRDFAELMRTGEISKKLRAAFYLGVEHSDD